MMKTNIRLPAMSLMMVAWVANFTSFSVDAAAAPNCLLLIADRLFDGINPVKTDMAVLVEGDKITRLGASTHLSGKCGKCSNRLYLGNATILPGFIDANTHISFQKISKDKVLAHGITTAQDTGGTLKIPEGGVGKLRLLSSGPILQAPGGYPLNVFGGQGGFNKIGYVVASVAQAEKAVLKLYDNDAAETIISLEPGGEVGAPWMQVHNGKATPKAPWPMLPLPIAKAIVSKAQEYGIKVVAQVGENTGFKRALDAGVDQLAYMPCARISENLLTRAVKQGVSFVTSLGSVSACRGARANMVSLSNKHAKFIYGSQMGQANVPLGINSQELQRMLTLTSGATVQINELINVLKAATSSAGEQLGVEPLLGRIAIGAPADIIAVRGNPLQKFKLLESPDLVMSGGKMVINKFK
jgi:imidazolonepropionase-like amidohydrolase